MLCWAVLRFATLNFTSFTTCSLNDTDTRASNTTFTLIAGYLHVRISSISC